jgi:sulfopropanediol 3-dehydrogenase
MVRIDYVVMSSAAATDLHDYEQRELAERVAPVLDAVRRRGDQALIDHWGDDAPVRPRGTEALPGTAGVQFATALGVSGTDIERYVRALPAAVIDDLALVQDRTRRFAEVQRAAIRDFETEALPGVRCGIRHVAVDSAGVCLPAEPDGLSLQTAQAAVIAARAAGVERIVGCIPAARNPGRPLGLGPRGQHGLRDHNRASALTVGALSLAGVDEIYIAGGVRGLAALAFGTESIPRVEIVIGGGDEGMAEAHRQLAVISTGRLRPGILVLADGDADPELIAADLISADACGANARGVLITTSPVLAARVSGAVERQLDLLPRSDDSARTWYERGTIRLAADPDAACRLADRHGLDRVEIMTDNPHWYLRRLRRCRHVFLGESAGAVLSDQLLAPTTRLPGADDPGSVANFLRAITYCEGYTSDNGAVARLHRLTGEEAHARACEARAGRRLPALATIADG